MYLMDKQKQIETQREMGSNFNLFCPLCGALLPLDLDEEMIDTIKVWGGVGFTAYCDCGWKRPQYF